MKNKNTTLRFFLFVILLVSSNSIKCATYYLQASGNLTVLTSWNTNPSGGGSSPSSFNVSGDIYNLYNVSQPTVSLTTIWGLNAGAIVNIGDGTNTTTVIYTSSGRFGVTNNEPTLNFSDKSTIVFQIANDLQSSKTNFLAGSYVVYDNSALTLASDTYWNVDLLQDADMTGSVIINGTLTINPGVIYTLSNQILTLNGTISGLGSIAGDNGGSTINLSGTGNIGNLNFEPGFQLISNLNIALGSSASFVSLNSDLTIDGGGTGGLAITTGGLDLNTHNLTVQSGNSVDFTGGKIIGSANSNLVFNTDNFISDLNMDGTSNSLKSLTLNNSSAVFALNNALNITDSLSVLAGAFSTGGFLTLKSSSPLKGRIGRVGGSISGNVTVETFIPGGTTGWAALGVPGINGQNVLSWDTYVSSGGTTGVPMTCVGCAYDPTVTGTGSSSFVSIQDWNEPTLSYTKLTSASSLSVGTGHWVYVGDGFTSTNDLKLVNTGSANFGTGSIPISKTTATVSTDNGFNLIANPYPSPISWNKLLNFGGNISKVSATIYGWNADVGGGGSSSFNGSISNPAAATSITNIIPSGQAFYVEAASVGNAVLDYDELIKMNNNTGSNPLQKPATIDYGLLRLSFKGQYDWDETAFMIHKDATASFDMSLDARKLFQSPGYVGYPGAYTKYTTISSKDADKQDYSINCLPPLTQSLSIPILARVSTSGTYTISAFDFQNFDMCVGLIDKLDNSYHDLRMAPYTFSISDTTSAPRFELILCKDESLNAVGITEKKAESNSIFINQDAQGAYVKTAFEKNTKACISVYNVIGQKLMKDISVEGTVTNTPLPIDLHNQVVLIKVTTDKESVTKKVVLH